MSNHEWLDVYGYIFTGAVTLIAVLLGYRLTRHDQERKGVQATLEDHGNRLTAAETVIELIKQTFRFKS